MLPARVADMGTASGCWAPHAPAQPHTHALHPAESSWSEIKHELCNSTGPSGFTASPCGMSLTEHIGRTRIQCTSNASASVGYL
eukprot:349763-Chlamydomonas_euryale.AAC.10